MVRNGGSKIKALLDLKIHKKHWSLDEKLKQLFSYIEWTRETFSMALDPTNHWSQYLIHTEKNLGKLKQKLNILRSLFSKRVLGLHLESTTLCNKLDNNQITKFWSVYRYLRKMFYYYWVFK